MANIHFKARPLIHFALFLASLSAKDLPDGAVTFDQDRRCCPYILSTHQDKMLPTASLLIEFVFISCTDDEPQNWTPVNTTYIVIVHQLCPTDHRQSWGDAKCDTLTRPCPCSLPSGSQLVMRAEK